MVRRSTGSKMPPNRPGAFPHPDPLNKARVPETWPGVQRAGDPLTMAKSSKTFPIGRKASDGKFTSVPYAKSHPNSTVVERMPKPGHGDSDKPTSKK